MKRCPKCNSTYSDETLSFCLSDGAALLVVDGQETEEFSTSERDEMRIEIPKETVAIKSPAPVTSVEPKKRSGGAFLMGILAAFLLLAVVGIGGFAVYFLAFDQDNKEVANTSSPTPDEEVESLKKELEELKGKVEEKDKQTTDQKESSGEKTPEITTPVPAGSGIVNSPADGFLALRTLPNHKTGQRIAKIPHGTTIYLSGCLKRTKIGKRTGSWCRSSYGGQTGWVFDAWVRR